MAQASATVPQKSMQVVLLKDESGVILTDGECDVHDDVPVQAMSKEDRRTHAQSVE